VIFREVIRLDLDGTRKYQVQQVGISGSLLALQADPATVHTPEPTADVVPGGGNYYQTFAWDDESI
jgi:hypothetical protein